MSGYANTENVFYCLNSTFLCRFLLHNYNIKLSSDTFYGGIILLYVVTKTFVAWGSCSIF